MSFFGYTVRVTLKAGPVIQGTVGTLEGSSLTLTNAFDTNSGIPYPFYQIDGKGIGEIEVLDDGPGEASLAAARTPTNPTNYPSYPPPPPQPQPQPQPQSQSHQSPFPPLHPPPGSVNLPRIPSYGFPPPQIPMHPQMSQIPPIQPSIPPPPSQTVAPPSQAQRQSQPPAKKPFQDPAIVSVGRPQRPTPQSQPQTQSSPLKGQLPPPPSTLSFPVAPLLPAASPSKGIQGVPPSSSKTITKPTSIPPGKDSNNNITTTTVTRPPFTTPALTSPFSKLKLGDAVDSSAFEETDDSQAPHQPRRPLDSRPKRGRRDPNTDNFVHQPSQHPRNNGNANLRRGRDNHHGARESSAYIRRHRYQNSDGWATEDVTGIKDTEFDFQGNLERFDKKAVFSQIQTEDTTAVEDRLVSFNKRPPVSTEIPSIRKNFKNSENVLGTYANGASLADRETWNDNAFLKKGPDFGSSSSDDEEEPGSGRSSRRGMTRPARHGSKLLRKASVNVSGRISPNISSGIGSGGGRAEQLANSSDAKSKPILRLKTSSRPCPVVSPLQMLDVERIAEVDLGLTDDMMSENAGRGIAQVAIQAFGKRLHSGNHNSLPVVLVFAGNNKNGARAVAAGRHLKNHHVRVLICVLGLEREEELLDHLRRQIQIFRNAGGRLAHWNELSYKLQSLDSPPELIIDGLLGMHVGFEDLRLPDQASLFELVKFANASKAQIMSIDVPSGIDGSTGEVTTLDDSEQFYIEAKFVVCMGAPKTGVRAALQTVGAGWNLHVVDIGIPNTAWRKYGSRRRHGVEFGAEWVSAIEYIL
ncbi:enhancer of mRNA decapping [Orbilia oligospora]|uniref:Enhancer of mRNA-decapping protein 3 n=1 Tax=Orbilia oligospora TaxID=2813651 RepID=A0A7C8N6L3_ORBOL|nr:enhancer of mRNA decapping [Orbilia oligospora]KAF3100243.1 enhancer of mRNA decapping [Orbilia oligospora]KAF3119145.1 enhancer of mRNA decapping [Orbilia oligospora]KAF3140819.1 enhancer of mRNA decapping [Orbilia oligospora]KAF3145791.1 enhancer of mRNA decapping [Orbilia oligospora]